MKTENSSDSRPRMARKYLLCTSGSGAVGAGSATASALLKCLALLDKDRAKNFLDERTLLVMLVMIVEKTTP